MSSTTSKFDQLADTQAGKEVRINQLLDSLSPAALGGRRESTTTGLTWGYYGGQIMVNGVPTDIPNGTVTLTGSATNYIGLTQAGVIAVGTTRNPLHAPLYSVVTTVSGVTSYTDERDPAILARHCYGIATQAMADANQTISQAQSLCETLVTTGALTATRNLVVPLVRRSWKIRNNCTGGSIQVIGSSGTGITIATVKTAIVECDGTNVLRITADV